jgi:hypothetical protein
MGGTQVCVCGGGGFGHARRGLTEFGGSLEEVLSETAVAEVEAFFFLQRKKKSSSWPQSRRGGKRQSVYRGDEFAMYRGDEFAASNRYEVA